MPEQPQFDYDVFISYSSLDKTWVRGELLKRIEEADLRAFIDFRDFARGAPSIKECERGVEECRKTLIILTPDYLKSGWAEFENIMVQTLDPANESLRLIPLLKVECKKPLRIGALTHIDFTAGADLELAWRQLLTALGAPPEPEPPKEPRRDQWFLAHPYPMPPNFTGRVAERAMLDGWLGADGAHPLLSLRALGGFGKSALVWHWLTHDVDPAQWARVVWWSFYEGDPNFESFLVSTLEYLGRKKIDLKEFSAKDVITTLLKILQPRGTLLVLDGFERVLRAFGGLNATYQGDEIAKSEINDRDCISPLADLFLYDVALQPNLGSKVLLTTRICPRVLEAKGGGLLHGCREEELKQLQPADAVEFFRARGIRGRHAEIETACEPYGHHPLSLRLLAGLIVGDFQQPGDIAAAKRLDVSGDLVQRQHHVLEMADNSPTPARQALLGGIACFRSPVNYETLKALTEASSSRREEAQSSQVGAQGSQSFLTSAATELDTDLRDLIARGLLHHDTKEGRFDLHPIVRRYAYDRLAAPDRVAAHTSLRDYFATMPRPKHVSTPNDLMPVIEFYFHTARSHQYDDAWKIYRHELSQKLFMQFCTYQTCVELLGELIPKGCGLPQLKDQYEQGVVLNGLSAASRYMGDPAQAVLVYAPLKTTEQFGGPLVAAIRFGNIARSQIALGKLGQAEKTLKDSIDLFHREITPQTTYDGRTTPASFWKSASHSKLAVLHTIRGDFIGAEEQLRADPENLHDAETRYYRLVAHACHSLARRRISDALEYARGAWQLKDQVGRMDARDFFPRERDLIRADRILGASLTASTDPADHKEAERYLHHALERCRRIRMVDMEADILIDLARLRVTTDALDETQRLVDEALLITERSGYVLQGADAHLELAKLALTRGDKKTALHHATEARRLATCDGPPDYTYKVAYDEAGALLAQLKQ